MTETELAAVIRGLLPVLRDEVAKAIEVQTARLHDRLLTVERRPGDEGASKDLGDLRARIGALEADTGVPGPIGPPGAPGRDGLGFDDLAVIQIDERTAVVRAQRDGATKDLGTLVFPVELYRGVYVDGKTYDRGDAVTWSGSEWHCNESTVTRPGNGSGAWTLKVKRGRDGKDGKDATT